MNFSEIFPLTTMNIVLAVLVIGAIGAYVVFVKMRDGFQDMTATVAGGAAHMPSKLSAPKESCEVIKKQLDIYTDLKLTHGSPIENIDNTIAQMKESLRNYGCDKYVTIED